MDGEYIAFIHGEPVPVGPDVDFSIVLGECGEPARDLDVVQAKAGLGYELVRGAQNLKICAGSEGDGHPGFVVMDLAQERLGVILAGDGEVVRPGAVESIPEAEFGLREF